MKKIIIMLLISLISIRLYSQDTLRKDSTKRDNISHHNMRGRLSKKDSKIFLAGVLGFITTIIIFNQLHIFKPS